MNIIQCDVRRLSPISHSEKNPNCSSTDFSIMGHDHFSFAALTAIVVEKDVLTRSYSSDSQLQLTKFSDKMLLELHANCSHLVCVAN